MISEPSQHGNDSSASDSAEEVEHLKSKVYELTEQLAELSMFVSPSMEPVAALPDRDVGSEHAIEIE